MEKFLRLFGLGLWLFAARLEAAQTIDSFIKVGQNTVHYGVYEASKPRIGDILYLHGFGDRFKNHEQLFEEWNSAGFRVIGFDLPSHGETEGTLIGGIDFHSFESLAEIAQVVVASLRSGSDERPFFLAGWSLGGLLATRIAQTEDLREGFPGLSGLILYAPALAPQKCVGNIACQITNASLSHNTDLAEREIKPKSPLLHLAFGARIILASTFSWQPPLPADLQTLVLLASDKDAYIHTPLVIKWIGAHRSNYVSRISSYQCAGAKHELDNEPDAFGGDFVRGISRDFVSKIARGEMWQDDKGFAALYQNPCTSF